MRFFALGLFMTMAATLFAPSSNAQQDLITQAAQRVQQQLGARVGVAIHDTGSDKQWLYNANDRFPLTSTAKVLICANLLSQGNLGLLKVPVTEDDMVSYSPITRDAIGRSVALNDLCAATLKTSDNTAANLVLHAMGGPQTVTTFLRDLGDEVTRLDRNEPEINEARKGDLRDTTSPAAMVQTLQKLLLGQALPSSAQKTLIQWLENNVVSTPVLRAGLPIDWRIGDRTGAGDHGTRSVVAIIWPPNKAPILVAIYLTETKATMQQRNAAIADIGRALVETLSH